MHSQDAASASNFYRGQCGASRSTALRLRRLKVLTSRSILAAHGEETGAAEADELEHLQACRQSSLLGAVEATDEEAAIKKAGAEFNVPDNGLMAVRR